MNDITESYTAAVDEWQVINGDYLIAHFKEDVALWMVEGILRGINDRDGYSVERLIPEPVEHPERPLALIAVE